MIPTCIRWMIIAVLALFTVGVAKAEYVDLRGGMQITNPMRCDEEVPQVCVIVTKDEKEYLVVIDAKGERKLYEIVKDNPVLIWDRDSI
jgi:hypothetical protein